MKVIRLNLGFAEISVRLGRRRQEKEIAIRKYEVVPREFAPEIHRELLRRLKRGMRTRSVIHCGAGPPDPPDGPAGRAYRFFASWRPAPWDGAIPGLPRFEVQRLN